MFQFLIGRLDTFKQARKEGREHWVSIPHRQAGYGKIQLVPLQGSCVSIPHRQAGYGFQLIRRQCPTWFQFLIGRLDTPILCNSPLQLLGFNSSQVGWILLGACLCIRHYTQFQFLIGRLDTILVIACNRACLSFNSSQVGWIHDKRFKGMIMK